MRLPSGWFMVLLAAVLFAGCGPLVSPRADFPQTQREFARFLRWGEYQQASRFLPAEYAAAFREHFAALDGLHITEIRTDATTDPKTPDQMQGRLEIDYYRLPSVTLKTRVLRLAWRYQKGARFQAGRWIIDGPFPPFP